MLGSRIQGLKFLNFQVEVVVVKGVCYVLFYQVTQHFGIYDITRTRIYLASYTDREVIVVAMIVGVVTLAKNALVGFLVPSGVVKPMGCIKVLATENRNSHSGWVMVLRAGSDALPAALWQWSGVSGL